MLTIEKILDIITLSKEAETEIVIGYFGSDAWHVNANKYKIDIEVLRREYEEARDSRDVEKLKKANATVHRLMKLALDIMGQYDIYEKLRAAYAKYVEFVLESFEDQRLKFDAEVHRSSRIMSVKDEVRSYELTINNANVQLRDLAVYRNYKEAMIRNFGELKAYAELYVRSGSETAIGKMAKSAFMTRLNQMAEDRDEEEKDQSYTFSNAAPDASVGLDNVLNNFAVSLLNIERVLTELKGGSESLSTSMFTSKSWDYLMKDFKLAMQSIKDTFALNKDKEMNTERKQEFLKEVSELFKVMIKLNVLFAPYALKGYTNLESARVEFMNMAIGLIRTLSNDIELMKSKNDEEDERLRGVSDSVRKKMIVSEVELGELKQLKEFEAECLAKFGSAKAYLELEKNSPEMKGQLFLQAVAIVTDLRVEAELELASRATMPPSSQAVPLNRSRLQSGSASVNGFFGESKVANQASNPESLPPLAMNRRI